MINRSAFTLIELIFVIVIIGILTAIAIPKLNATRIDAKISVLSQKIVSGIDEILAYSVSKGHNDNNITTYSNIFLDMVHDGDAVVNNSNGQVVVKAGSENSCVTLRIVGVGTESNLTVTMGQNIQNDIICQGVQSHLGDQNYSITIRGHIARF